MEDPRPLTVSIKGYGYSRTKKLDMSCGEWARSAPVAVRGLRIGPKDGEYSEPASLRFDVVGTRKVRARYSILVQRGGKALARYRATVRVTSYKAVDIYEDQDDFVNYCINDNHTIYSRNHRLYCVMPAATYRFLDIHKR
jgi:hypothetical protein